MGEPTGGAKRGDRPWRSLRLRITLAATAVVVVVLVTGGVGLAAFLRASLLRSASGSALERTAEVTALAAKSPLPAVLPVSGGPRRTLVQVIDRTGTVVASTPPLPADRAVGRRAEGTSIVSDLPGLPDGRWLLQPTEANVGGRLVTVVVITSIADVDNLLEALAHMLAFAVPAATAFVALVVWVSAGRALRPVEAMREEVDLISGTTRRRRLAQPGGSDEIARLANTLNDMLDRLSASDERQRRFVADASHEMRTPVANLLTAVEVAIAHPDASAWPAVADDLLAQATRLHLLTDDLLTLSRAEYGSGHPTARPVDLVATVAAELDGTAPSGVTIERLVEPREVIVDADGRELGRAIRNLLDNAVRHATGKVVVSLWSAGSWAELAVSDDGPGVPGDEAERIFDPFVRLDAGRQRTTGGTGLGLAIAREIVTAYGGTVRLDGAAGGATFRIRLPLSPSRTVGEAARLSGLSAPPS